MKISQALLPGLLAGHTSAGFLPSNDNSTTTVLSQRFPGAKISYKETFLCETTPGAKAYSGYVTLPKDQLPDAVGWEDHEAAHLWFWYFESRNSPSASPTSIYIGGGPGSSSLDMMSGFPCTINSDSNSTTLNKISWNNHVNMLYIDQPVGTGFSYVSLQDGTLDILTSVLTPANNGTSVSESNLTNIKATLHEVKQSTTVNTTMAAARTMWQFAQIWSQEFPEWRAGSNELSLWTTSYGGFYGPAFFSHFLSQNDLITSGTHQSPNATVLNLGTLGLGDGCTDIMAIGKSYPHMAFNNTYGIEAYSKETYDEAMATILEPETGCYALIHNCRAAAKSGDPLNFGNNSTVNRICGETMMTCFGKVQGAFTTFSDRTPFDITMKSPATFPDQYHVAYFNQPWVQEALGVPLNFTSSSTVIPETFLFATGETAIRDLSSLEHVLENGINVALYNGDRDYRCSWLGAENVTLSMEFPSSDDFKAAGYAPLVANASYEGGLVREAGNLSFSRVFQAGHGAAAYQPETIYRIFERAMFGLDIATGEVDLSKDTDYVTVGPSNVFNVKNEVPEPRASICYLLNAPHTCTESQLKALADGTAVVRDWVIVEPRGNGGSTCGR